MEEKTVIIKQSGGFGTFLRGAMIGAAVALLLAPRTGRETRDLLSERSSEIKDKATYLARDTRDRAENIIHEARDRAEHIVYDARNKVEETIKHVKDGTDETTKELKREVEILEDVNNPDFPL